ncbi:MAG: NfeD family protein [Ruminiclostridium sp.]|nr:NfeD family protein [Ruminiclostridium sp.]
MEFYILVTVVSVVAFTADMILRYMEKIRSFGMETRLHNIRGKTIPVEDFIPHNLTMVTVFGAAMGISGIFLKLVGFHPFISFPIALASGCLVNFAVMHFIKPFISSVSGDELSDSTDLTGKEAVCSTRIGGDDYGRITLEYHGRKYEFDAISEYETSIEKGEKVYVLYRDGHFCVVEKQTELLDILNEKE